MNFQEVKNYFHTLNEAKNFRSQLWKKNNIIIENLTEKLYDDFDIEESVFIINDFFNKDIYSLDKIDVLIKLDDNKFEELVESKIMAEYITDDINFHFKVGDKFYLYNNYFFKKENINLNIIEPYNDK